MTRRVRAARGISGERLPLAGHIGEAKHGELPTPRSRPDDSGATGSPGEINLGPRLRAIRQNKGMTLRRVADRAGISESFLSQAERNQTNPSVSTLLKIADALGESLSTIFGTGSSPGGKIVRSAERPLLVQRAGSSIDELLTPVTAKTMQVIHSVVEPEFDSGEPYSHAGEEEFVMVLSGLLEIESVGETYLLREGDSILVNPVLPHAYRNPGAGPTRCLWVTSLQYH